ncbi:MAG: hypothetical protein QOH21_39, partial [Acidobacteriota bacterium]|nr:hypothetical protein [Acidobacteriota bacterium]
MKRRFPYPLPVPRSSSEFLGADYEV